MSWGWQLHNKHILLYQQIVYFFLFQKAHREKLKTTERNGETYEKLIVINPNIVSRPVADVVVIIR
jgi:hypothetical protein